jgi:predicted AAA+ superfamily ATPase
VRGLEIRLKVGNNISTDEYTTSAKGKTLRTRKTNMIKNYTTLNSDNFSIYPHINFIFKTARKLKNLQKIFMVWRKFSCLHAGC